MIPHIRLLMPAIGASAIMTAAATAAADAEATVLTTQGVAPLTVHAHALASDVGAGDTLTARFSWSFGDPSGRFNELDGFNAAHVYDEPGTYEIRLTVTDRLGDSDEHIVPVTVLPDDRRAIFVAPDGDDFRDGATPARAVRTVARVQQLLTDDAIVRFRAGGTYATSSPLLIDHVNVGLSTWSDGAPPVLFWNGAGPTTSAIVMLTDSARNVLIEGLVFDSPATPDKHIVRGVSAKGVNITVRDCHFDDVSYAITAEGGGAHGLMTMNNTADAIGAYYIWGQGTDHVHVGNDVEDSVDEHNMRFAAQRVLVAHNDLRNTGKSCIWFMSGSHGYAGRNVLREGPLSVGPLRHVPNQSWRWAALHGNRVCDDAIQVQHGAEHVLIAGSIIEQHGGVAVDIDGYDAPMNRTSVDVRVINNTGINHSTGGRFIRIGPATQDITIANNMYVAPHLQTGSYGTANVFILSGDLGSTAVRNNLWAEPAATGWGDGWHYLWPLWSHVSGYRDAGEWAALPQTSGESYRRFAMADLNDSFVPQFDAVLGDAEPGVHLDAAGSPRPLSGPVTVGAMEIAPPADDVQPDPDPDPDPGPHPDDGEHPDADPEPELDIDFDDSGVVDADDLLLLIGTWGPCAAGGQAPPEPLDEEPMARFLSMPASYVIGSGLDLEAELLPAAPSGADIVFQVWSFQSTSIEAAQYDYSAPFIYPSSKLDQVTPGSATVQAIVRDADNDPEMVIRHRVEFVESIPPCTADLDGDGDVDEADLVMFLEAWI